MINSKANLTKKKKNIEKSFDTPALGVPSGEASGLEWRRHPKCGWVRRARGVAPRHPNLEQGLHVLTEPAAGTGGPEGGL